ncbi:MAG: hypothetical protein ACRD4T_00100 [Candidatus Acidiferrales bacterium]
MADYEELFPGRFLKSADLKGKPFTLTISSISTEEIDGKVKALVTFEGAKKQWVMNRTGAEAIKLMFGRDYDTWIGKRITIHPVMIKDPFGDGDVGAIRVKGSPEIDKAASATVQRGRKTIRVAVVPTGQAAAKQPAPNGNGAAGQQAAAAPSTGEPPPDMPLQGKAAEPEADEDIPNF